MRVLISFGSIIAALLLAARGRADDEVVVRGARSTAPSRDSSVAASVVSGGRLAAPAEEASDVLRTEPGVGVVETGGYGALSTASIRGATAAETPVYLAGIRLNDDLAGTADLSLVPLWLLDKIEIYRGNAPLESGQLGIGGGIFFEPHRPKGTEATLGAMAGSFGARSAWAHVGAGDARSSVLFGARYETAANDYTFQSDNGLRFQPGPNLTLRRTNADATTWDAWGLGTTALGREGRVDVLFNTVTRDQGLPGLALLPTESARGQFARQLGAVRVRVPCAENDACVLTSTTSLLLSRAAYEDPLYEIALGTSRADLFATRGEEALTMRWDASDTLTISPSLRGATEDLAIDDLGAPASHARRLDSRASALAEWSATNLLTLRALGSFAYDQTLFQNQQNGQSLPEGRLGVQVGHGALVVMANGGYYGRLPTLGEMYGISGVVRGNPALGVESGLSVDAGLRAHFHTKHFGAAYVDLFAFGREADNLVAYARSSLGYVTPYNVGRARVAGVEALVRYEPRAWLLAEISSTLLDPRDTSPSRTTTNDILPYESRLLFAPRVDVHTSFRKLHINDARVDLSYVYQASRYADTAGLIVIPEQGSCNLEMDVNAWGLSARLRLADLFNQTRFDLVGYPLPGRAAYAALEAKW